MFPEASQLDRFNRDLGKLVLPDARIGIAVSGGSDSLALLLLAVADRAGRVEAATVDHALRCGSREEAEMVARVSSKLGVAHAILTAQWPEKPLTAIQERAREERYRLLADWAGKRKLDAVATAHHLDDQAETFLMRLARGAGVRGLSAMRPASALSGSDILLVRPLLGWRRSELEQICASSGIAAVHDPSNEDERFERIRVRRALNEANWLDPEALALSASNLAAAEDALEWAVSQEWRRAVSIISGEILYRPNSAPSEIQRRIVARAVVKLASEGVEKELRGRELDRLVSVLAEGGQATIRGVCCTGGAQWRFTKAKPRKAQNARTFS